MSLSPILLVAPLPPPVHGLANANLAVQRLLIDRGHKVVTYNIAGAPGTRGLRYHLSRAAAVARALLGIVGRPRDSGLVYMSVDGGWGAIYCSVIAAMAKLVGLPVAAHHHSFAYIDKPSGIMRRLLQLGRPDLHVFLCDDMRDQFAVAYRETAARAAELLVLPNSALQPDKPATVWSRGSQPLTIGHMSNLTSDKGCDLFLDLLERLDGHDIRAVLAGPIVDDTLAPRIEAARARYGARFEYRGPVHGDAKVAFFQDIDVFVFPTKYRNEAQPLVLLEAIGHGRPVVSLARGCISCDHGGAESLVIDDQRVFLEQATGWLAALARGPDEIASLQSRAAARSIRETAAARQKLEFWHDSLIRLSRPEADI